MDEKTINLQEYIQKIDQLKKQDKMDLSSDQDLSLAIMNLISIEEHLFFTGAKTGNTAYYDLINQVRDMRKGLLKKLIKEYEGEVWCISKHLLAAAMRLMEVGTKQLNRGMKEEAYQLFNQSFELYSLFWGLNMKLITADTINKSQSTKDSSPEKPNEKKQSDKSALMTKLTTVVKKIIDCCIE